MKYVIAIGWKDQNDGSYGIYIRHFEYILEWKQKQIQSAVQYSKCFDLTQTHMFSTRPRAVCIQLVSEQQVTIRKDG